MAQPVVQTIHRDPALFWWILLPITVVMILTGILRHYAMTLLQTTPKKADLPKIRQQRSLIRGVNLRTNANVLSPSAFATRKAYMVQAFQEGKFLAEPEQRGKPRPNPMSDPAAMEGMMGMMKGNMAMMIPQTLIMGWINAFFSGFVISKSSSDASCTRWFAPLGLCGESVLSSTLILACFSGDWSVHHAFYA
ncbi:hypothetical protein NX059_004104 [Plenodomus lindquistii]|nr:hypothetical protein NX059_004104 [Plenodomus lindquistii]